MVCYKLNIFMDCRESWTESALNAFININPIYIYVSNVTTLTEKDEFKLAIFGIIANCIIKINEPHSLTSNDDIDFRILNNNTSWMCEGQINVKNNFKSVIKFLMDNNMSIYQKSIGKYWCRYYIELNETSNKGNEYSIEEIKYYIKKMFEFDDFNESDESDESDD